MPRLSGYSPEAVNAAAALAVVNLLTAQQSRVDEERKAAVEQTERRRTRPASPSAFAKIVQPTKWDTSLPHTALMDQAFVYLARRQAPVWWVRRHLKELDKATGELVPVACEGYADDDLYPLTHLVVNAPPRHGKSELFSRFGSTWYLGEYPSHRVMLASYAAKIAYGWSRRARDAMRSWGPTLWGLSLGGTAAADNWEIAGYDGGLYATGVRGAMTGRGANFLMIDDPVKDAQEAQSETLQESNWDWVRSVALTRLEVDEDGLEPAVLVTMARWNEKDVVGRLLEQDLESDDPEDHYLVLHLPAIAEEQDAMGRDAGEALWPQKYPLSRLERLKARIGSYFFSALYQGRPAPLGGGMFPRDKWQRYRRMPVQARRGGIFIDTATDDKTVGDFFAMATVRTHELGFYWERVLNQRLNFNDQVQAVLDAREASKRNAQDAGLPIYIEEVAWSLPLIRTLKKLVTRVIGVKPGGVSKIARAMAVTPYHESEACYLPEAADWVADFVEQHAAFPSPGWHDDMVDTTSLALYVLGTKAVRATNTPVSRAVEYVDAPDSPQATGRTPNARLTAREQRQARDRARQLREERARPPGQPRRRGGV